MKSPFDEKDLDVEDPFLVGLGGMVLIGLGSVFVLVLTKFTETVIGVAKGFLAIVILFIAVYILGYLMLLALVNIPLWFGGDEA